MRSASRALAASTEPESVARAAERSEIPEHYKWNLERVYPDWESWERDLVALEESLPALAARRGTLGRSAADLLDVIETVLDTRRRIGIIHVFAALKSDEDTRVGQNVARRGRATTVAIRFAEATAWFEPELLALAPEALQDALQRESRLEQYRHFLDEIQRLRDHTLPAEQEALIAAAAHVTRGPSQVFSALNNADLKFTSIKDEDGHVLELTKARYQKYVRSPDRRVRREAFEGLLDGYGKVINTLAANLDAQIKSDVFYAQARRYPDSLEAALYPNAIPVQVYESLVKTTGSHLETIHRYTAIKKRILDVEPLCEYDLYVPLFAEAEQKFGYEEAQQVLLEALAPLGQDYLQIVREGFTQRWIDVHENAGKRSGAYSNGVYGTSPYILLNWSDQLHDTFTLAHEMGHSLHSYLSNKNQPYVYADYPIFTAEVASTCNEMLLLHTLMQHAADRRRKLFLLDYYATQINDTVCRQTMFAEIEREIHRRGEQGQTLTAETLGELYVSMLRKYWGPLVTFDATRSGWSWARIPHLYYNYYVYQYATAYAAATALSRRILAGEPGAASRYVEFLSSGCSRYPVDVLQRAGVDMTGPEPIAEVYALLASLLDEMETLLAEEK